MAEIIIKIECDSPLLIEEIKLLRKEQAKLKEIIQLLQPQAHPVSLSLNFKNKKMNTVEIGKLLEGVLELDDQKDGHVLSDAKFSGDEVTSSDETVATVVVNAEDPSKVDATPISAGTFTVHVKCSADYTDSNNNPAHADGLEADSQPQTVSAGPDGVTLKINFPGA